MNSNVCYDIFLWHMVSRGHGPNMNEYTPHPGWMLRMRFNYFKCPFGQESHFGISGFDLLYLVPNTGAKNVSLKVLKGKC